MLRILFVLILICMTSRSWAGSTICKVEGSATGIKAIGWNDEYGTAKVTNSFNNSFEGIVTLKRKHNEDGVKVNLYFMYEKPNFGEDAAEYIVFPVSKNEFRVIGVTYVKHGDKLYLNTSEGNHLATCISM